MKNAMTKTYKLFAILFILLVVILAFSYFNTSHKLKSKESEFKLYKEKNDAQLLQCNNALDDLNTKNAELNQDVQILQSSFDHLNQSYSSLNQDYSSLASVYTNLTKEATQTMTKINDYERELQENTLWFRQNAVLNYTTTSHTRFDLKGALKDQCIIIQDSLCKIKTACPTLLMRTELGIYYAYDQGDWLQSIDTFIQNQQGDCEDYSLMYKAEWNYLLDLCGTDKDLELESFVYNSHTGNYYFMNYPERYYLTDVSPIILPAGYIYPIMVCGSIYDPNTDEVNGHCIVALTQERIHSIEDFKFLDHAPLVEPQLGQYLGDLNDDSSGLHLLTNSDNPDNYKSYISEVITDDDLYLYSRDYHEWQSYTSFRNELEVHRERLIGLMSENP